MIFRPELAEKVLRGEKTQTRRALSDNPNSPWSRRGCMYHAGGVYAVQPGRGKKAIGQIRMLEVRLDYLSLDPVQVRAEGFESLEAFRDAWIEINGWWRTTAPVWALTFEVVS